MSFSPFWNSSNWPCSNMASAIASSPPTNSCRFKASMRLGRPSPSNLSFIELLLSECGAVIYQPAPYSWGAHTYGQYPLRLSAWLCRYLPIATERLVSEANPAVIHLEKYD